MRVVSSIARKNPNDLEKRPTHFRRCLAKAELTQKDISNIKFLHFESYYDMEFVEEFLRYWKDDEHFSRYDLRDYKFVFTWRKKEAIAVHKSAIEDGCIVTTLVDMDHDLRNKEFKNIDGVFSTRYALTLTTMQFLKSSKKLDEEILHHVVKEISNLDEKRCLKIIERALENTLERLNRSSRYAVDNFEKMNIKKPLNDHDLVNSILAELGIPADDIIRSRGIEKQIKSHAKADSNGKLRGLLQRMIAFQPAATEST
jgi:hypothetical protein